MSTMNLRGRSGEEIRKSARVLFHGNAAMRRLLVYVLSVALSVLTSQGAAATLPELVSGLLPMYPERARTAHMQGTVKLRFMLSAKGEVTQAEAISGHLVFEKAALECVKSWKFNPQSIGSTEMHYETEFVYTLRSEDKKGQPKLTVSLADYRHVEISSGLYVETIY